jgi:hypothetical protein
LEVSTLFAPGGALFLALACDALGFVLGNTDASLEVVTAGLQAVNQGHCLAVLFLKFSKLSLNGILAIALGLCALSHQIVVPLHLSQLGNCHALLFLSDATLSEHSLSLALGIQQLRTPDVLLLS